MPNVNMLVYIDTKSRVVVLGATEASENAVTGVPTDGAITALLSYIAGNVDRLIY